MFDSYQMVTDRICELLEQGIKPWQKPWKNVATMGWSGVDGREYSLLNQMLLATPKKKYTSLEEFYEDIRGEWLTFKQVQERGGRVKKGEHGRQIVFFTMLEKQDEEGNIEKRIPMLKVYTVFHVRQCEGIEQKFHNDEQEFAFEADANAESVAKDYIEREGITYTPVKGNRAYYSPTTDTVVTPLPEQFEDSGEYYSTLFHELTHSTGHESRLNRISKTAGYGKEEYSLEELVAEIGSASLCATMGIDTSDSLTNSAAYIKGWLKALKNDKKMIVFAAARAEKAVRMILNVEA